MPPAVSAVARTLGEVFEYRLHRAHHERQADKDQDQDDSKARVGAVDAEGYQVLA